MEARSAGCCKQLGPAHSFDRDSLIGLGTATSAVHFSSCTPPLTCDSPFLPPVLPQVGDFGSFRSK